MILKLSPPLCVISKESVQQQLMNCDLENSFLLVYLSFLLVFVLNEVPLLFVICIYLRIRGFNIIR